MPAPVTDRLLIRRATLADLPAIVKLLQDDSLGATRELFADPLPPEYGRAFAIIDADPNQALLVGELDGAVVATCQLTCIQYLNFRGRLVAQVEAVRVAREWRGRKLGEALMRDAFARARVRGCHRIQLTTNKIRTDARRFYERLGFTASHEGMKKPL